MRVPILAGRLRGRWWLPLSGGKLLRIVGGTYEPEQTRLFEQHLKAGDTLLDVGAHVGYYTLVAADLVGDDGRVVSFEPNPRNCAFLRRHVEVNGCRSVQVEEAAVSDANGVAGFDFGTGTGTGHLTDARADAAAGAGANTGAAASGAVQVRTVRLDDYCREHDIAPDALKIDVEGAELHVLLGAEQVIETHGPVIFLSTHGADIHRQCLDWLRARGYALSAITGADLDAATEVLCTRAGA